MGSNFLLKKIYSNSHIRYDTTFFDGFCLSGGCSTASTDSILYFRFSFKRLRKNIEWKNVDSVLQPPGTLHKILFTEPSKQLATTAGEAALVGDAGKKRQKV